MRTIVLSLLALAIYSVNLIAVPLPSDARPGAPTADELVAAKKVYAKFGGTYRDRRIMETDVFVMPVRTTDADLKGLPNLPFRFALELNHTKVTDAGMREIKPLKNLTVLLLFGTQVTDAGLKEIKELKNLAFLSLNNTQVTDSGLKELKDVKNLTVLSLGETNVTDAGAKELKEFKKLASLNLMNTKVTVAGLKELEQALPNCKIYRSPPIVDSSPAKE